MLSLELADIRRWMDRERKTVFPLSEVSQRLNSTLTPSDWVQAARRCTAANRRRTLTRILEAYELKFVVEGEPLDARSDRTALQRITVRSTREDA